MLLREAHLGEYETLKGNEKYEYIIDAVEFQSRSKLGKGVSQFESLLEQFDLSGKVDDDLRRHILELQQVRHVLVHRNGIVDKRLLQACPWIVPGVGKTVFIDHEIYEMYYDAVLKYAFEIGDRAFTKLYKPKQESDIS